MNKKGIFAIVVVTYNREKSLSRLLESLSKAYYGEDLVDLIISIDYSGENKVLEVSEDFDWKFGEKKIINHQENLGLKRHILKCGQFTKLYQAICVFEDDIFVSPSFYSYAKQSYYYYRNNPIVGGISIYSHKYNYLAGLKFDPIDNGKDTFFMQQAQSWGQIWYEEIWNDFYEWYELNKSKSLVDLNFPKHISSWPESSWLKYHMKYLYEKNLFFVYPYKSLCTNFTEIGTHAARKSTNFQVPISSSSKNEFSFSNVEDNLYSKYDVWFENIGLKQLFKDFEDITIDLYGNRDEVNTRFLLSTKKKDYKILKSYDLELKPHENNIIFNVNGNVVFLYDRLIHQKNKTDFSQYNLLNYYFGDISFKKVLCITKDKFREIIENKIK
ncbi:Glycosyl transferase family 2 [Myroides sp. A21]|uniref:glycosyltransferase n=1 Tax=Myroides sp. A21 TaxID=1583100 RepID=UPI00057D15EC|nr:glycosyltransferase [Myroides sp. A21]AJA70394.1 Glycosyl transferase family 2 [Myroides sp. A21]